MAYIRKLTSGRFQAQIRLKGLRPITRSFNTKKMALQFAREVEGNAELSRSLGMPLVNVPKFKIIVDEFMRQYQGKDSCTGSRLNYWSNLFGDMPITQIDEHMLDNGLVQLAKARTGSTVNRYKSALSSLFIYFIRNDKYKRLGFTNPVRKESVSRYKENPPKERFLSEQEQQALLNACRNSFWEKMYLLTLMALTTGARKGELTNLKWSDIDFKNRTASLDTTKNGKPRLLPLTQPVIEELIKFRENTEYLIFHAKNSMTTPFNFRKYWMNALRESGINHCRFHDCRHTAASNLVRAGRSLFEVGTLLGHSSTSMTARYSHLAIQDTQSMVDTVMGGLR